MRWTGILACLLVVAGGLTSCRRSDRPGRSKVVVYCSVDQKFAEIVLAEFERQTGIKVLACYDTEAGKTTGLANRLLGEKDNPQADVFWSSEVFHTIRLARHGVLAPYESETTRDWPAHFRDKGNHWYGFALRARVIAYNTTQVKPEEAPKSLEDLLDPKWKGRIAIANPAHGTTGGHVASWFAQYGDDGAREILTALRANDVLICAGNSDVVRRVARGGAVAICLTDTDDVYVAQRIGQPIAMDYCDQGGRGVLVIPNTASLVRGGPNAEAAADLMEFLLSKTPEKMLVESDSHNTPVHEDLANQYPQYSMPKQLQLSYEEIAEGLGERITAACKILEVSR